MVVVDRVEASTTKTLQLHQVTVLETVGGSGGGGGGVGGGGGGGG